MRLLSTVGGAQYGGGAEFGKFVIAIINLSGVLGE